MKKNDDKLVAIFLLLVFILVLYSSGVLSVASSGQSTSVPPALTALWNSYKALVDGIISRVIK